MQANINHHFIVRLSSEVGRAAPFGGQDGVCRGEKTNFLVVNEKFSKAVWSDFSSITAHSS